MAQIKKIIWFIRTRLTERTLNLIVKPPCPELRLVNLYENNHHELGCKLKGKNF